MKKFILKTFISTLFILCFVPTISFAADMFFSSAKNTFIQNEDFLVQIFLDTREAKVNAVEGAVSFPADLIELKEIRDGNSSLNFWVDRPHSVDNNVSFSGITTGGFAGSRMFLFSLVFHAKTTGSGSINFNNIQILQNDGVGTKISTTEPPFTFTISEGSSDITPVGLAVEDVGLPENFNPLVASDPEIFEGKNFLVFSTVDKGTGIDHFEIRESPWFLFGLGGSYVKTESPYLLKDQMLKSKIYVKAVDKAGNFRIVKIGAQNRLGLLEQSIIIAILLFIIIFLVKKVTKKHGQS